MNNLLKTLWVVLALQLLLTACNVNYNPDIKTGSELTYIAGYPEVNISSVGYISPKNQPYIRVTADLIYGSLIFKSNNDTLTSKINIIFRVKEIDSKKLVHSDSDDLIISNTNFKITESQEKYTYTKHLDVPLGSYEVEVTVTDLFSSKSVTYTTNAFITGVNSANPTVSNVEMLAVNKKSNNGFKTIPIYHVASKYDSLKFRFQVTNTKQNKILYIRSKLLRFRSDTTYARRLGARDYTSSNIQYKGLDYDIRKTVNETRRALSQSGNVFLEITFPILPRGNYRYEVTIRQDNNNVIATKARDFGIKSKNFPTVETIRELARPLVYIMDDDKYDKMMALEDPSEIKKEMDKFWLQKMKNVNEAQKIIEYYYQRVIEANKKFSNFKEGWKTDPGMVYILFGPPWFIDPSSRSGILFWNYSYTRTMADRIFRFERVKSYNATFPFHHYIVDRKFLYNTEVYKQIQLWLNGQIIEQQI